MTSRTILRLELRQLRRTPAVVAGVLLLVAASFLALQHGRTVIDRQRAAIAASPALEREHHRAILEFQPKNGNAGDQLYYLFFHTAHEPSEWAAVSLGQRDLQPFNLKVRLLALQGQIHDSDIVNPLLASFGSFDLAFVIVFVMPLYLIALTHNVWSAERELGTWDLIRAQPASILVVLIVKLSVRTLAVLAPALLAIGLTALVLKVPLDTRLASVVSLTVLYGLLWTGASLIVIALRRSSDFNLVTLLGLWIVWCILGPALVNAMASLRYPVPEALELTVRQRQGYHAAWDRPLHETMDRFYVRYPEWRGVPVPGDTYSNAWYYAMQQRGDDEADAAVASYHDTLERRSHWVGRALVLFPPALLHAALNDLARTDLESHLAYLASVGGFHEELKRFFFPAIFHDETIGNVEWEQAPRHHFRDHRGLRILGGRPGVMLAGTALLLLAAGSVAMSSAKRVWN